MVTHSSILAKKKKKNPMGGGAAWAPWGHKELDRTESTEYARSLNAQYMYISHTFQICVLHDCWWWVTGRTAGRKVAGPTVTGSAS